MRAPQLETHDAFEGIGAHELNTRFDWIPEEHGDATDDTEFDPPDAGIVPNPVDTPALSRVQSFLLRPSNKLLSSVPYRLDGSDTSHYQFTQGGGKMAIGSGLWWWMHKAAQSIGYRDATVEAAIIEMFRAGVEIPGTYLWGSSTTDPQAQAANWIASVPPEYRSRLVWMGDMEEGGLTVDLVVAIYEAIEAVTKRPCSHYTGFYVSGGAMFLDPRIRMSKYGPRPIIVAAYVSRERFASIWAIQGRGLPFDAQQFSSNGPVPDVVGRCDMDEVVNKQPFIVSLYGQSVPNKPSAPASTGDSNMSFIIHNTDNDWYATIDSGYAVGVDGGSLSANALPVLPVSAAKWGEYIAISDNKKKADAALANGITVNVPAPVVQFPAGFNGTFT